MGGIVVRIPWYPACLAAPRESPASSRPADNPGLSTMSRKRLARASKVRIADDLARFRRGAQTTLNGVVIKS
jgi:hypothetical protein